jgi:tetratricopeptide (TPR) repeat protein
MAMQTNGQPTDSNELLNEAMSCHQRGNLFDADHLYAQAIDLDPQNAQALRLRGILARERGDLASSLRLLEQAATIATGNPEPLAEIALSRMALGELGAAEAALRKAMLLAPDYLKGLTNLGALLQHRGHLRESEECYLRVLDIEPDNIEVRCNLAKALVDAGKNSQALAECDTALNDSSRHPHALATLGAVLTDLERYTDARNVLEEANRTDSEDDMALVNLALACYQLGDAESATGHLQKAVMLNPYNARALADLVNCLLATGRQGDAVQLCETFLRRHPGERLVTGAYALALHNAGRESDARVLTDCSTLVQAHTLSVPTGFGSLADFNFELADMIRTHPSLVSNPISKSTFGGDQTGELNPDRNPLLEILESAFNKVVGEAAERYRDASLEQHPVLQPASDHWTLRTWGTLLHEGGRQTPHMHPLGWLSGVYYVQLPTGMTRNSGQLEFGRPPERFFREEEPECHLHKPREGELVLFPSWFWHQTIPFETSGDRISIAFDAVSQAGLKIL